MSEHSPRLPKCFEIEFAFARFDFPIPLAHFRPSFCLRLCCFLVRRPDVFQRGNRFILYSSPKGAEYLLFGVFCLPPPLKGKQVTQVDGKTDRAKGDARNCARGGPFPRG